MTKLELVIIHGTKRNNNKSHFVARHIERKAIASGDWHVTFVDPNDLHLPYDGNDDEGRDPAYTAITAKADAFFLVTPEYNHSFPATLKRILDSELKNYIHKAVAVAGVSSGRYAGVRAVAALAEVLRELGLVMTFHDVLVGDSYNAYDEESGEPKHDYIDPAIVAALTELKWMAQTLKHGREHYPNKHHQE